MFSVFTANELIAKEKEMVIKIKTPEIWRSMLRFMLFAKEQKERKEN